MQKRVKCPACGKEIAVKGIPGHTGRCPKWDGFSKRPPSEFDFDRHYCRGIWADDMVEGEDYVCCQICAPDVRAKRLADHLKNKHDMTVALYQQLFDGAPVAAKKMFERRRATVQERFGVDNVFQADEIKRKSKETSLEKYRIEHASRAPDVVKRRKATNMLKYGHENPLGGKGGIERARKGMLKKYGIGNPQQVPHIRKQTVQTNRERYGVDYYFETEAFLEKFKATSQKHWGVRHPMMSVEGQLRCKQGTMAKLGVENPLCDPSIWKKSYATNLANHGGKHSQQCPEVLEKARAVWLEKYGVDNPSKCDEVKSRIKEVWMGKYGVPFPPQSLWTNRKMSFPNKLEQAFQALAPAVVVYAGDGSYWVRCKGASKARNPDFVVLDQEQLEAYKSGVTLNSLRTWRICEVFGDYWHGPMITGKSREEHKSEVVDYYKQAGIDCLIVWEEEIKKHPKRVSERLLAFLTES